MSDSHVDARRAPAVGAALRWALVGVAAGTVVSGFRALSGVATDDGAAPPRTTPHPPPPPSAVTTSDDDTRLASPPSLPAHERVLVTVASPAGTPYRRPAPVLMGLPVPPAAASGSAAG